MASPSSPADTGSFPRWGPPTSWPALTVAALMLLAGCASSRPASPGDDDDDGRRDGGAAAGDDDDDATAGDDDDDDRRDAGPPDPVRDAVEDLEDAFLAPVETICACAPELGLGSEEDCREEAEASAPRELAACLREVIEDAENQEALLSAVGCLTNAFRSFDRCIARLDCDDEAGLDACADRLGLGVGVCLFAAPDALALLAECGGGDLPFP